MHGTNWLVGWTLDQVTRVQALAEFFVVFLGKTLYSLINFYLNAI